MTFGPIVILNPAGADGAKSSANSDGAFSVTPAVSPVAESLGGSAVLAGEAAAGAAEFVAAAACCVAAGAVLSREHVASSDATVRMTVMLFENFISFADGDCRLVAGRGNRHRAELLAQRDPLSVIHFF